MNTSWCNLSKTNQFSIQYISLFFFLMWIFSQLTFSFGNQMNIGKEVT